MAQVMTLPGPCYFVCDTAPKLAFKARGDPSTFPGCKSLSVGLNSFSHPQIAPESITFPSAFALNRESRSKRIRISLFYDNVDALRVPAHWRMDNEPPPLPPNSSRLPKLPHLFSQLLKTPARGALRLPSPPPLFPAAQDSRAWCITPPMYFCDYEFHCFMITLTPYASLRIGGWTMSLLRSRRTAQGSPSSPTSFPSCSRLPRVVHYTSHVCRKAGGDMASAPVVFLLHHHRLCHCDFIATESRPIGPPRRLTLAFRLTFTTNFVLLHRHHHHRLCHCRREPRPIGPPDPPTLDLSPPPPFDLALRSLTTTITSTTMTINCLQPAVLECKSLLNRCTTGTFLALLIALIVLVAIRFGRPTSFEGIGRWIRLCRLRLALREVYYQAPPTLAQLRALPPLPRVAGLTEFRDSYAKDGPGAMYVTAVAANNAWKKFCSGLLPADDFLADLRVKVGHAKKLPVRQRQYQKCDVDQRHFWLFCFYPKRRILAEQCVICAWTLTLHARSSIAPAGVENTTRNTGG
ncbi:hypothetical protein C8F04DRAFT_1282791 [Mycena alexandri]|uniref:Uncharacterized protein n=1 Tax=Mycena alexandri TaxID=1745969 RepID=A0AAD6RVZ6_9AGAR|nr:hypothetical protein C8F04DRAFT_1282791 [Mycena alexandri]